MQNNDPEIISYRTLRWLIGVLGIFLPVFLFFGSFNPDTYTFEILSSISAYYYSWMRDVFVGVLFAIAVFLFSYHGYTDDKKDKIATNIAGACALGVALFPTADTVVTAKGSIVEELHFIFAAIFFATLAYISLCLFTKSTKPCMTPEKQLRNKIFIACGWIIVLMLFLSAGNFLYEYLYNGKKIIINIKQSSPLFYFEAIGLIAFAISWLVKGEVVLSDSKDCDKHE